MAVMRALILFLVFSVESASVEENCPYGWTHFGMKCYKFFSQSVNWTTAEKNCQSVDANLASVHNTDEHNFLLNLIVPATTSAWVGGHDGEIDGQWLWSDASQFNFTSWCSGEPNNYQGNPENCLQINFTNNSCWNDGQCSSEMSYICAKPLRSC
ncbi:galactose-specific lectin nattectin-like isoform X2 [Paramisgurnus dabryanus]|uniref:galactose-specific lectin nattectin-like isoform X2 n=1 Tax=Paramisgurnus dabryanus TaxID=90735 RepID=UPI0031F46A44